MIKPNLRHFFQSDEWAEFQKALGKEVIEHSSDGWQYMAVKESGDGKVGHIFKRLYVPYGPSYSDTNALKQALNDLEKVATEAKVDYVRVEPVCTNLSDQISEISGYTKLPKAFQPSLTLIADLDRPFDEVLQDMTKTYKYLWNKISQNNLTFSVSDKPEDIDKFLQMMTATAKRTNTQLRDGAYLKVLFGTLGPKQVAHLAYVYHSGQPLAGALFVDDQLAKTRYYLYAGSFDEARQYNANSPLLTFLMKDAHDKGITSIEYFGVSPLDEPKHRWAGLSQFKRSFGGEERKYIGTWEKPIRSLRYKLMSLARKLA